jgi:hypothetical protein
MSTQFLVVLFLGLVVVAYAVVALTAYMRMRGTRIVTCPETERPAAVTVDAAHAALGAMREHADIKLATCSRWPEREGCAQACAAQIEVSPRHTLAFEVLKDWYAGKSCAICRRTIPPLEHMGPKPGLLSLSSPSREVLSWEEIPAQNLPALLQTHLAVCSHCQIAESFRRQYPELVIDRPRPEGRVH